MQHGQAAVTGELDLFLSMPTKPKWQVVTSKNITWEICHARGNARRVHKLDFLTIFLVLLHLYNALLALC